MNGNSNSNVASEDSFVAWELVTASLERFAEAWDEYLGRGPAKGVETGISFQPFSQFEPDIANFVPDVEHALQHVALVELVKLDLDYRWRGQSTGGDAAAVKPAGGRSLAVPAQRLTIEDYLARFPLLMTNESPPADLVYEEYHVRKGSGDSISVSAMKARFPGQSEALGRLLSLEQPDHSMSLFKSRRGPRFRVGDRVDDFDLLTQLGTGAFAVVFLARQRSLQRLVALKISADQGSESQTLAQLDHPHIVRIYDQRILKTPECKLLYMNYVAGGTLKQAIDFVTRVDRRQLDGASLVRAVDVGLDQQGQSAPAESANRECLLNSSWDFAICRVGTQLAGALQYAHEQGVLHRDLKPANILLTAECAPKLVDFNISFCSKLDGANPTAYFGGSLAYMSPEQLAACDPGSEVAPDSLRPSSDLFSLGVVLWELYFGEKPYPELSLQGSWSETLQALIEQRKAGPANIDPWQLTDSKTAAIHETLRGCLAFDAQRRFQSGERLQHELRLCANPEVRAILRPDGNSWIRLMQSQPLLTLFLMVAVPSILGSLFNIYFNGEFALPALGSGGISPEIVHAKFNTIHRVVNALAYALGLYVIVWRALPLLRAIKSPEKFFGPGTSPATIDRMRREALLLGPFLATACIVFWSCAGLIFPVALQLWGVPTWPNGYFHFVSAHVLSGMIAGAYPFLAISWFALRAIYPRLSSQPGVDLKRDQAALAELSRQSWFWMASAILLPMFAVLLMAIFSQSSQFPLAILSIGSFLGSILYVYGTRRLQMNIGTLMAFNSGI